MTQQYIYQDERQLIEAALKMRINTSIWDIVSSPEFDYFYSLEEFVIADTETTGFDGEIIEIGAVVVKGNCIRMKDGSFMEYNRALDQIHNVDFFGALIHPKAGFIPQEIVNITHIDMKLIEDSIGQPMPNSGYRQFAEPFQMFLDFCGGRTVVGHNFAFDINRITDAIVNHHTLDIFKYVNHRSLEQFFESSFIDTYADAKKILKVNSEINLKNASLAARYGAIANENTLHRAYYDTFFSGIVFYGLLLDAREQYLNLLEIEQAL